VDPQINGGFTKNGSGILIPNGDHSYTGETDINNGTLVVNGTLGATNVYLFNNSLLRGRGTFTGAVSSIAGSLGVGGSSSPGVVTFNGGLTLLDQTRLSFALGASSDQMRIPSGTFQSGGRFLAPGNPGALTVNLTASAGFGPGTYDLIDATGSTLSGFDLTDYTLGTKPADYSYRLAISGSILRVVVTAAPSGGITYSSWQQGYFSADEIANGTGAKGFDVNQDGTPNLLHFALGVPPRNPSNAFLPSIITNVNGSRTLRFFRARTTVTYTVEKSTDLIQWTTQAINPGSVGQNVNVSFPMGIRSFLRVRVQ
jgi:autotransporter-associated beta strand protein